MAYKWGGVILSTQWVPILQVLQSHWKESNAKPPTSLTAGMKFGPGLKFGSRPQIWKISKLFRKVKKYSANGELLVWIPRIPEVKGIVTKGYPDSKPKPPGPKPAINHYSWSMMTKINWKQIPLTFNVKEHLPTTQCQGTFTYKIQ